MSATVDYGRGVKATIYKVLYGHDGIKVEGFAQEFEATGRASQLAMNRPREDRPYPVSFALVEKLTVERHDLYLRDGDTVALIPDSQTELQEAHRLSEPHVPAQPKLAHYVAVDDRLMEFSSISEARKEARKLAEQGVYSIDDYEFPIREKIQVLTVTYDTVIRFDLPPGQQMSEDPGALMVSVFPAHPEVAEDWQRESQELKSRQENTKRKVDLGKLGLERDWRPEINALVSNPEACIADVDAELWAALERHMKRTGEQGLGWSLSSSSGELNAKEKREKSTWEWSQENSAKLERKAAADLSSLKDKVLIGASSVVHEWAARTPEGIVTWSTYESDGRQLNGMFPPVLYPDSTSVRGLRPLLRWFGQELAAAPRGIAGLG